MKFASALPLAALACASCAAPTVPDEALLEPAALIGGIPAGARELDAVGALVIREQVIDCDRNEQTVNVVPVCTATLIGPQTVVTAKHCLGPILSKLGPDSRPYFLLGADRARPKRQVEVVAWDMDETFPGGWTGRGRDVAVLSL
ncbi:MAG: trypsin-like serine protease, partial [Polyangiales bacterium]